MHFVEQKGENFNSLDNFLHDWQSSSISSGLQIKLHVTYINTPLGAMIAAATEHALCLLQFVSENSSIEASKQFRRLCTFLIADISKSPGEISRKLAHELQEYFAGRRRIFTVPLQPIGTTFQLQAWNCLSSIPYGETRSYSEQAQALGKPKAIRAVAQANRANPIAILIPCHRVIGADGNLVGYSAGIYRKKYLLELEKRHK